MPDLEAISELFVSHKYWPPCTPLHLLPVHSLFFPPDNLLWGSSFSDCTRKDFHSGQGAQGA